MKNYIVTAAQGKTSHPAIEGHKISTRVTITAAQGKVSMPVMAGQGAAVFA